MLFFLQLTLFAVFSSFLRIENKMTDCITTSQEMMTELNTNGNQEQSECENTVPVASPCMNDIESFDNPDFYPDLEFVVAGMERPLQLHKRILARSSGYIKPLLNRQKNQRLEWPFDTTKEADRDALVKVLRFCYGETQIVGTKNSECIAMIVALTRLQVTDLNDVVTVLSNFAMDESKRNVEIGVELLKTCIGYRECYDMSQLGLDKKLAATVFTKDNMQEHYKEVVDDCLMVLPPEYLMFVEFGEPHTRCSEFCLRTKYVRFHSKEMTAEEKRAMVFKCDWSTLNSQELQELHLAEIIDRDELLEAHEKALERCEIEKEQATEKVKSLERKMEELETERNEEIKRVEEMKRRAEIAEKEKDEQVKQAKIERDEKVRAFEIERDKFAEEMEEFKTRAEMAEKLNLSGLKLLSKEVVGYILIV